MTKHAPIRPRDFDARKVRLHETVGKNIARLRIARGMLRAELARLAFINERTFGDIEQGIAPCSLFGLVCIAEALGVSVAELVEGRGA